jgi:hypothetical protein
LSGKDSEAFESRGRADRSWSNPRALAAKRPQRAPPPGEQPPKHLSRNAMPLELVANFPPRPPLPSLGECDPCPAAEPNAQKGCATKVYLSDSIVNRPRARWQRCVRWSVRRRCVNRPVDRPRGRRPRGRTRSSEGRSDPAWQKQSRELTIRCWMTSAIANRP